MPGSSPYASKFADTKGVYHYTAEENAVWQDLVDRQITHLRGKISNEFFTGIKKLAFIPGEVPQISAVNDRLASVVDFGVEGVPAIIPPAEFFGLLARRKFPVATFIRRREDIDYIEEPDIFHEIFGHCPFLTNKPYTDFVERFGKLAVSLGKAHSWRLFRLFWFTVEFGMIRTPEGLRGYGAGIASSPSEATHATSGEAQFADFDLLTIFRTPYRIDILQPLYFVIDDFAQLAASLDTDIAALINKAVALGDLPSPADHRRLAGRG